MVGAILLFAIVASGYTDYDAATDWYRVVDQEEIAALDHLVAVSVLGTWLWRPRDSMESGRVVGSGIRRKTDLPWRGH